MPWTYAISDLHGEEIVGTFYEKQMKKTKKKQIKQNFELKKYSREKGIKYMLNGKARIILLIVRLIKKKSLYKMDYFPERHTHSKSKIEFEF